MRIAFRRLYRGTAKLCFSVCLAANAAPFSPAAGGEIPIRAAGIGFNVRVTSLKEARFRSVVKQQYDFSCGSAAVATLLTYHYEEPTGERDVFKAMFEAGDKNTIRERGFSLLDIKNYLEPRGYRADGYRVPLDKLIEARLPAIMIVDTKGYKHFVVIKGSRNGEILVGDPARGLKVFSRAEFEKIQASDIIFLITNKQKTALAHYNDEKDWAVRVKAPFGTALSRQALGSLFVMLPGANQF